MHVSRTILACFGMNSNLPEHHFHPTPHGVGVVDPYVVVISCGWLLYERLAQLHVTLQTKISAIMLNLHNLT